MTETIILIFSIILGLMCSKLFIKNKNNSKLLLTFSGAFFLAMTVLEILPDVYSNPKMDHNNHRIGLFVLLGVIIQSILETVSKGVEHGHIHLNGKRQFPTGIFGGLFLHSIIEGIPVSNSNSHNFLWAIFVHNIPVSMILFNALSQNIKSHIKRFILILLFALAGPLGYFLGKHTIISYYSIEMSAIVSGIFLHISTVILFETNEAHHFNIKKFLSILIGFTLAYFIASMHT